MIYYLLAVVWCAGVQAEYNYSRVNLEHYCGQTVNLTCPDANGGNRAGRAGTLVFTVIPMENCSVSVQAPDNCSVNHAVYFNLPWARLALENTLDVYEDVRPGSMGTLIMKIQGRAAMMNRAPDSVAQLLTSYRSQQRLSFNLYIEANDTQDYPHEIIFDYTIIRKTFQSGESYCRALDGYVPSEIICTDPNGSNRISCPTLYTPSLGMTNRAFGQQTCGRTTTTPLQSAHPLTSFYNHSTTVGVPELSQYYNISEKTNLTDQAAAEPKTLSNGTLWGMILTGIFLLLFITYMVRKAAVILRDRAGNRVIAINEEWGF